MATAHRPDQAATPAVAGLRIAIADADQLAATRLRTVIARYVDPGAVTIVSSVDALRSILSTRTTDAVFVDPFSFASTSPDDLISTVTTVHRNVHICIYSSLANLLQLDTHRATKSVPKLQKTDRDEVLVAHTFRLLSQIGAEVALEAARSQLASLEDLLPTDSLAHRSLQGAIQSIERAHSQVALQAQVLIPGIDPVNVPAHMADTMSEVRSSLLQTSVVSIAVGAVGCALLVASFVASLFFPSQQIANVAFGAFGIAGIVAALITSPLRAVSVRARRLVQLQITYLGFLSQLAIMNENGDSTNSIERSHAIGEELERALKALKDLYGN